MWPLPATDHIIKGARKYSVFTKKIKTSPRDHQKWIQGVRFTPRGSEKRAPMQFEQFDDFDDFDNFKDFDNCTQGQWGKRN